MKIQPTDFKTKKNTKVFAEVKKELNCKIVMDLDDDWVLPANHINYHTYEEFTQRIENKSAA